MKGCLQYINSRWDTDYFFSMDKKDFDELVKNWEIESTIYADWFDTKKQLFITLHVDLEYWNETITQDLDGIRMKFSYKLLQNLMQYDRDTFEHRYNRKWDKFIFFIKDSYQKLRLDHNLNSAEDKTSK
jgi:hypothetical protein